MWLTSVFALWRSGSSRTPPRRRPASTRLGVEVLEDRAVPAFLAPVISPGGDSSRVVPGDFNNDGITDLLGSSKAASSVYVQRGNGDGTFQGPLHSPGFTNSWFLETGDINGDGNLDVAAGLRILLGQGDGTFQQAQTVALPTVTIYANVLTPSARDVALGDLNNDGRLDLVITASVSYKGGSYNLWGGGSTGGTVIYSYNTLDVFLGQGDGTFSTSPFRRYLFGNGIPVVAQIKLADFNRDGNLDVLSALNLGGMNLRLGNGDGTLRSPMNLPPFGNSAPLLDMADVNNDGKLDIVAAPVLGGNVTLLLGRGDGTFQASTIFKAGSQVANLAVGDFNHDGCLDLATQLSGSNVISVRLGKGDGTFQASLEVAAASGALAVADVNGDGWLDLAVCGAGSLSVLLNDGNR